MNHKIRISIPEPCHENWFEMPQKERGRFCNSCQKDVIDFTESSNREIVMAFNENENLCGRFKTSQLKREIIIPKEKKSFWIITAASLIAFLGVGTQTSKAQGKIRIEKISEANLSVDNDDEEIEVNGQIIIDDINPNFEDVEILVSNKNKTFHPSADGKFCFMANKKDSLIFSKTDFGNYNTIVYKLSKFASVELYKEKTTVSYTVGGAYVVKKRSLWYRLFHKN